MSKKRLIVHIRGKHHTWGFDFIGDPNNIPVWKTDGLEVFEMVNTVPMWVADLRLVRLWCVLQDLFHLKNPIENFR